MERSLKKRQDPGANHRCQLALYDAAVAGCASGEVPAGPGTAHKRPASQGTVRFRLARRPRSLVEHNHTAGYGVPVSASSLPTHSAVQWLLAVRRPVSGGIIEFKPDPSRGTLVYGARFADFCKVCRRVCRGVSSGSFLGGRCRYPARRRNDRKLKRPTNGPWDDA